MDVGPHLLDDAAHRLLLLAAVRQGRNLAVEGALLQKQKEHVEEYQHAVADDASEGGYHITGHRGQVNPFGDRPHQASPAFSVRAGAVHAHERQTLQRQVLQPRQQVGLIDRQHLPDVGNPPAEIVHQPPDNQYEGEEGGGEAQGHGRPEPRHREPVETRRQIVDEIPQADGDNQRQQQSLPQIQQIKPQHDKNRGGGEIERLHRLRIAYSHSA